MSPRPRKEISTLDLRDQPAYTVAEAARYLHLAPATLRSWVVGRAHDGPNGNRRSRPLIHPASRNPPLVSFWNLIEAYVLASLRTGHDVSLQALRRALKYAEDRLAVDRLLLRKELCTTGGEMFLERYGELINLSASGQLAIRRLLEERLKRVDWDERMFPVRLHPPTGRETSPDERSIVIDPRIAFGRPVLLRVGVSTGAIVDRIDAGETVADLAADYTLTPAEIELAVLYERVA